jgi:hypothetical protein
MTDWEEMQMPNVILPALVGLVVPLVIVVPMMVRNPESYRSLAAGCSWLRLGSLERS